jgi:hypothetical protein
MVPEPATQAPAVEHDDPRGVAPQAVCQAELLKEAPHDDVTDGAPVQVADVDAE